MSFTVTLRRRSASAARRIALPEADDPRVRDAANVLVREGVAHPVLVGRREALEAAVAAGTLDEGVELADGADAPDASLKVAAELLGRGVVDGVVAGAILPTAAVLRVALKVIGLRPGVRTLSSSFYMEVGPFRSPSAEVLTFTDAGVVPQPGPRQLAEIAVEAARARRLVVGDDPRVAFLSFSTLGSASGPPVDKVREALDLFRTLAPDVPADGELQGDAALVPDVASRKAPDSPVAGRANVLVFPSLEAGNIAYKLVQRLAHATALGPILQGPRLPINDLSRGASVDDIVNVSAITALMAGLSSPAGERA